MTLVLSVVEIDTPVVELEVLGLYLAVVGYVGWVWKGLSVDCVVVVGVCSISPAG